MNKSELIDAIAASADIPKAVAGRALDAVIESVTGALKAGDSVVLVGFGTFAVKERAARTDRDAVPSLRKGPDLRLRLRRLDPRGCHRLRRRLAGSGRQSA